MPKWMILLLGSVSTILILFFAGREWARLERSDGEPVKDVFAREYRRAFGYVPNGTGQSSVRTRNAIQAVLDIRKYEIDLYWKRATYFWAFIAVAYAAYGALAVDTASTRHAADGKESADIASHIVTSHLLWVVACFGLFLSVAWHLVNKGSKYWQENWENHLDLLEDEYHGPLYKMVVSRPERSSNEWTGRLTDIINGPAPFSVSKVNAALSFFNILVWVGILVHLALSRYHWFYVTPDQEIGTMVVGTGAAILIMIKISDTNQTHRKSLRATRRYAKIGH